MRGGKIAVPLLVCSLLVLAPHRPLSQEEKPPPLLMNLSELNLRVAGTTVVDKVSDPSGQISLSPKKGYQLVVIRLEGTAEHPCTIALASTDFSVLVLSEDETKPSDILVSDAVSLGEAFWILPPRGGRAHGSTYIREPGPVTIKVAVVVKESVDSFYVRYPVPAQGRATL